MSNALVSIKSGDLGSELIQLVSFMLDNEEYGVEVLKVREIIRMPGITKMPNTPLRGIVHTRSAFLCCAFLEASPDYTPPGKPHISRKAHSRPLRELSRAACRIGIIYTCALISAGINGPFIANAIKYFMVSAC